MEFGRREFLWAAAAGTATRLRGWQGDPASPENWTDAQIEEFLTKGKAVSTKPISTGVTNSLRVTLTFDGVTHDAHFQSIDEQKSKYETPQGTEMNFRDSWKYNIAAYRLDRLLGLRMVPPSVARGHKGASGAFTWWIVNATMQVDFKKKKLAPPDVEEWNKQMYILRVFDQLIFNTDRNLQNVLATPDWRLWMIDHTRAFRLHKTLKAPGDLVKCERRLYDRLQTLSEEELKKATTPFLNQMELAGVMARRDKIVEIFKTKISSQGEAAVLFDYVRN